MSFVCGSTRYSSGNALEAVEDKGRDVDEHRVVLTGEELIDLPEGFRLPAAVVKNDLHHSPDHRHVVRLHLVIVPGLDDAGIGRGHVHLTELREEIIVAAEDFHEPSPFVGDDSKLLDLDSVDHGRHTNFEL